MRQTDKSKHQLVYRTLFCPSTNLIAARHGLRNHEPKHFQPDLRSEPTLCSDLTATFNQAHKRGSFLNLTFSHWRKYYYLTIVWTSANLHLYKVDSMGCWFGPCYRPPSWRHNIVATYTWVSTMCLSYTSWKWAQVRRKWRQTVSRRNGKSRAGKHNLSKVLRSEGRTPRGARSSQSNIHSLRRKTSIFNLLSITVKCGARWKKYIYKKTEEIIRQKKWLQPDEWEKNLSGTAVNSGQMIFWWMFPHLQQLAPYLHGSIGGRDYRGYS